MTSSAADLQQVKLKPRGDNSSQDRSAPNFNICSKISKQHEETLRDYFFSTGMDRWYKSLKDDTFATEFIRITKEDGLAILSHRKALCKNNLSSYSHITSVQTFEVPDQLIGLQTRIDDIIASLSPEAGVFVKLTTRSPKDSAVAIAKARNAFLTRLLSLGERPSANDRLVLLAEVMTHSLRLVERRERIKTDLERFFATVKDRIPLEHYTVDFAWTEDRVYIIEVNTFDGEFNASTGLWNWEEDREQMMKGPLELRIREAEQDSKVLVSTIEPVWKAVVFPSAMAVVH
ncbi:hypothetical protein EMCRGX_G001730 [Ephydatia muelleri]